MIVTCPGYSELGEVRRVIICIYLTCSYIIFILSASFSLALSSCLFILMVSSFSCRSSTSAPRVLIFSRSSAMLYITESLSTQHGQRVNIYRSTSNLKFSLLVTATIYCNTRGSNIKHCCEHSPTHMSLYTSSDAPISNYKLHLWTLTSQA